jgi:molecular chaperone DnaK (HSP70)
MGAPAASATATYLVGIDLGTTHTVVASAPLGAAAGADAPITLFAIDQWVAPGELAARPLLPSVRYHPAPGELAASALPWGERARGDDVEPPAVIGELARQLGSQVPGRLVASAKSWLSHPSADRLAPLLPWGADDSVARLSPVAASASFLAHLRAAWNRHHPDALLEHQRLVLTLPASFDEAARALTLQAARDAGLPAPTLLEEPQAAFGDWVHRHRATLAEALAGVRRVLVCDVGGGTTDFTLIDIELPAQPGRPPRLQRRAVGQHLMLGGDNMDLALAHLVERRLAGGAATAAPLSGARLAQLVARCRVAKEQLLAADAPASVGVTLLGGGARLVGGARTVTLTRDEVHALLVDGFFPRGPATETARRARGGLVEFGLPYASDAAVTRHLASFLQQHLGPDEALPDAVLLNGGVFRAPALAERLLATLADWRGGVAPRVLHNDDPDVAVARGAVAHALARLGHGPRIGGGAARSLVLMLDAPAAADAPGPVETVCLLPRGTEPGRVQSLDPRTFRLRVGQPVRFHLASLLSETGAPPTAGALCPRDLEALHRLPPIATVIDAGPDTVAAATGPRRDITVRLETQLTEIGTLEVTAVAADDPARRWQLEFQLRGGDGTAGTTPAQTQADAQIAPRLPDAIAAIERLFGTVARGAAKPAPKEIKQLRQRLEQLLGPRETWSRALARRLFDVLWQRAKGRRRSADHERVWLNLAGWCLRPGFGDPLDGWRVEQLWTIFETGAEHRGDAQVASQWWTLWRRVAGGLPEVAQVRLLDDFGYNLQAAEHPGMPLPPKPPGLVKGGHDDMVRLGASLERIPPAHKAEVGDWLLQPLTGGGTIANASPERDELRLWALGRLGARQPFHGSVHGVVPVEVAAGWLDALFTLDWRRRRMAAFAAALLARLTGDRVRDIDPARRTEVLARLAASGAAPRWAAMVREVVQLDAADEQVLFGESLPPGLVLVG